MKAHARAVCDREFRGGRRGWDCGSSGSKVDKMMYVGQSPKDAALGLLTVALKQAGKGSWENIAVARVYYLMGDKAQGQATIDNVIATKIKKDDWIRIARIYLEAKEWDKAKDAFEKALALDLKDEGNLTEVGAWYNLHGDRAKAEEYFQPRVLQQAGRDLVHGQRGRLVRGVKPQ